MNQMTTSRAAIASRYAAYRRATLALASLHVLSARVLLASLKHSIAAAVLGGEKLTPNCG